MRVARPILTSDPALTGQESVTRYMGCSVTWKFDHATHIGGRAEQQDRVCVLNAARGNRHLLVVADGMGGHAAGGEAAQAVIETAKNLFATASGRTDPKEFLTDLFAAAHDRVSTLDSGRGRSPGSTCVALYLNGAEAHWGHIGDSRLYHFRGGQALSRTTDHSLHELNGDRRSAGPPESGSERRRNGIYMRLGGSNPSLPDFGSSLALPGDLFLLCSDGYWGPVPDKETEHLIGADSLSNNGANRLVSTARQHGGRKGDNIGVALAQWLPATGQTRSRFKSLLSLRP